MAQVDVLVARLSAAPVGDLESVQLGPGELGTRQAAPMPLPSPAASRRAETSASIYDLLAERWSPRSLLVLGLVDGCFEPLVAVAVGRATPVQDLEPDCAPRDTAPRERLAIDVVVLRRA